MEQGLYLTMDLCSDQCNVATTLSKPAKERATNVAANPENRVLALHYAAVLQHYHGPVIALCFSLLENCVYYPLLGEYFKT